MKKTKTIKRLESIVECLGYKIVYKKHKSMVDYQQGLTCPDLEKIYIDIKYCQDIASTLAHEIGHVILLRAQTPGHSEYDDEEFDLKIAENAADEIGIAICRALGHSHDFIGVSDKAARQIDAAKDKYTTDKEATAFIEGYCMALSDVLPSSEIQLDSISSLLKKVFEDSTSIKLQRRGLPKWHKHRRQYGNI